jgi:uncharacterized damage-inducible protein DinB
LHFYIELRFKDKWDFAEEEPWVATVFKSNEELMSIFMSAVKKAEDALDKSDDSILQDQWKLCAGDIAYLEMERWEAIRHDFGQNAHHRAQLGVFLRLLLMGQVQTSLCRLLSTFIALFYIFS